MTQHGEVLGTQQVAHLLRTDRKGVRRLVDRGALTPTAKLPGKTGAFVFDRADVEALAVERAR